MAPCCVSFRPALLPVVLINVVVSADIDEAQSGSRADR